MNHHFRVALDDAADDPVDRAIAAAMFEPMTVESVERTIEAATREQRTAPRPWLGQRPNLRRMAAAAVSAATIAAICLYAFRRADVDEEAPVVVSAAPRPTHMFYERGPAADTLVASAAPIFVAHGPARPVRLGEKVLQQDIRGGVPDNVSRLHVWDWSRSDQSRVVLVPQSHRWSAISPDGTLLLDTNGKAVEIATGNARQLAGFAVGNDERVQRVWFSPSGRLVAALIHVGLKTEQVQNAPPLQATTHRWALRVLEAETGAVVAEFPTAGIAAPAFSPDESSIIYAIPSPKVRQDRVVRRDLKLGQVIRQYVPAETEQLFEPVGIAVSPDGKRVAAGYYYGQIFVWEAASGEPVSRHDFVRADGTRDTFFQAGLIRFSPDGQLLAAASNNRLAVLEVESGEVAAQHADPAVPSYAHLRWSQDAKTITLVARAAIAEFAAGSKFPGRPTADFMPRIYEWDWKSEKHVLKAFRAEELR